MTKSFQIALVLTALDRASAPVNKVTEAVGKIGGAADKVSAKLEKVREKLKKISDSAETFGRRTMISGALTAGAVSKVMQPFEELEDVTARMELAYSNAQGKASKYFESIRRQTVELGNQLPGTTRDFAQLATSLKEAGITEQAVANGGLKAAGYLRTIFDEHDSKKVAEVVAGSLHAFNLNDDSLKKYIDIMQRAHYAFGMSLEDFKYGLPYIARSYGLLNPKGGLQAATNQTIMMGMLKQGGMEGSMIGESIGSFYSQLATRGSRLEFGLGRRGLMTKAGEYLKKYHTDLTVFDKKGSYVGDEALVKQIWRLKELGATAQEIAIIGNSLAGAVGSTIFTKLYQQGPEGWAKAQERLQNQLDLDQKIARLLTTLKNVKEAGMGTVTNLAATIGGALAPELKKLFNWLNDGAGKLQVFFEKQEKGDTAVWKLTKRIVMLVSGVGALGVVVGGVSLAISLMLKPIAALLGVMGLLRKGGGGIGGVLGGIAGKTGGPLPVYVVNKHLSMLPGEGWGFPGKGGDLPGGIGKAGKIGKLARVGSALGAATQVGGALVGGYAIGTILNDVINVGMEKATGSKSIGDWLYDKLHPPVGKLATQAISNTTVNFSPQVHVPPGADSAAIKGQVNQAMQASYEEFVRNQRKFDEQKARRTF